MKKRLSKIATIVCLIALLVAPTPTLAATNQTNTSSTNSNDDIINVNNLVSATSDRFEFERVIPVSNTITNNVVTTKQSFIKETATIIPDNIEVANRIMSQLATPGSKSESNIDTSGTVTINTTLYYDRVAGSNGETYVDLTKITGGYTMSGANGTTIVKGHLVYAQNGFDISGNFHSNSDTYDTTSSSWTRTVSSSWPGVYSADIGDIGCTYTVTMQRPSGSQWTVSVANHVS